MILSGNSGIKFGLRQFIIAISLSAYDYAVLYLGLCWLGVLSLGWTVLSSVLFLLLPEPFASRIGRYVIMAAFHAYLASLSLSRRCSFDLAELDSLRHEGPLLLAPNHPSLLDAVMVISRLPNVACVMKSELMSNVFLGAGARLARYIPNEPVRQMVQNAVQEFQRGSHVLLFPEGTRTTRQPVNALKGSIALIACQAQIPIQTLLIETNSSYLSKGWPLLRKPTMPIHYTIKLGKRFAPVASSQLLLAQLQEYFAQALDGGLAEGASSVTQGPGHAPSPEVENALAVEFIGPLQMEFCQALAGQDYTIGQIGVATQVNGEVTAGNANRVHYENSSYKHSSKAA